MAFVPQNTTDGADWHAKMREVEIPNTEAANIFLGDMVAAAGGASADGRAELVVRGAAGDYVIDTTTGLIGALVEFVPDFADEGTLITNFYAAGTTRRARLVYGSDVIYEAPDVDGSILAVNAGDNRDISVPAQTPEQLITGSSTMAIGPAPGTDALGQLRVIAFTYLEGDGAQDPDIGVAGAIWRCRLNNSADDHGQISL